MHAAAGDPQWDPLCLYRSPLRASLNPDRFAWLTGQASWPPVAAWQALLSSSPHPVRSASGQPIRFVEQTGRPGWEDFADVYEPRIWLKGEVQSRPDNWHDFYNALTWASWPRSKAVINDLHYQRMAARHVRGESNSARCPVRDFLTQFDESGVVVFSSQPELLALIRAFQWEELFWHHREAVRRDLRIFVFGHALLEVAAQPYIGMTGRGILLETEPDLLTANVDDQRAWLDARLAAYLQTPEHIARPGLLQPVPLLGYPDWHPDNAQQSFYRNTDYFRPGRRKKYLPGLFPAC